MVYCSCDTISQISFKGNHFWQRVFSLFTYALDGMRLCRNNGRFTFAGASLHWGALFICAEVFESVLEVLNMSNAEVIPFGGFEIEIFEDNIEIGRAHV